MKLFVNYYGYRANLYLIMKVSMFVCVLAGIRAIFGVQYRSGIIPHHGPYEQEMVSSTFHQRAYETFSNARFIWHSTDRICRFSSFLSCRLTDQKKKSEQDNC